MRYLAVIVICCCFLLNFMIYRGYRAGDSAPLAQQLAASEEDGLPPGDGVPGLRGVSPARTLPGRRGTEAPDAILVDRWNTGSGDRFIETLSQPERYRGIYLHNYSARTPSVLSNYVVKAKAHGVNVFVLDMQDAVYFRPGEIPASNIALCISNGIWPIARIVVFPYGLKEYPVPQAVTSDRMELARKAAELGFREIQFDYIRFEDSGRLGHISQDARYQMVEGFLGQARRRFGPEGMVISADVFGRVTLNTQDPIGQRLEGLDKVVDVICPMAYPSHYSWDNFSMANPYYTVYRGATLGKQRLQRADLVMYIQGFEMKVAISGLSLPVYIAHQMQASEDAGVLGWIVWNAAQSYEPTWAALRLLAGKGGVPGLAQAQNLAKARVTAALPKEEAKN